jgi:hypothetical protein
MLPYPLRAALNLGDLLDQPLHHRVGVGDRALTKSERRTDLVAVEAVRAPTPLMERDLGAFDTDLAGDIIDSIIWDLDASAWEPTTLGVEAQH